jgi:hypothetical protein
MKRFRIVYTDGAFIQIDAQDEIEAFETAMEHKPNGTVETITEVDVIKGIEHQHVSDVRVPNPPHDETVFVDLQVDDMERMAIELMQEKIKSNVRSALGVVIRSELALSLQEVLSDGHVILEGVTIPEWYENELDKIIRSFIDVMPHNVDILLRIQREILMESPGI